VRPAAQALAGFYPIPPEMIPPIAALVRLDQPTVFRAPSWTTVRSPARRFCVVDPCAGEGHAVLGITRSLYTQPAIDVRESPAILALGELEESKYRTLVNGLSWEDRKYVRHGDSFRLVWAREDHHVGASLLFLNPPFDADRECRRLEERWLRRFGGVLCVGGALLFVLPYYALEASADTLAQQFTDVACFRFPDADFVPKQDGAYKRVVVVARKTVPLLAPSATVRERVLGWAEAWEPIPQITSVRQPVAMVPTFDTQKDETPKAGFSRFDLEAFDYLGVVSAFKPWRQTAKRGGGIALIPGVLPEGGVAGLRAQTFPVVMPLHEGHVAPALACGVFDGVRIEPNASSPWLPTILLRAVFQRDWVTTDQIENKDGEVVGEKQVQQPRLVMTALDLSTGTYHSIESSAERTAARALAAMTMADVVAHYSDSLLATLHRQCPALHDPANPEHAVEMPALGRPPFPAQWEVAVASWKQIQRDGGELVLGQTGTGKTTVAVIVAALMGAKRILVFCPPHLLPDWQREIAAVLPGARVHLLLSIDDAEAFATATDDGVVFGVIAETTGKLGHAWAGIGDRGREPVNLCEAADFDGHRAAFLDGLPPKVTRCPKCGDKVETEPRELARKRLRCKATGPAVGGKASLAVDLATALIQACPSERVLDLMPTPHRRAVAKAAQPTGNLEPGDVEARQVTAWKNARATVMGIAWRLSRPMRRGTNGNSLHTPLGLLLTALAYDALTVRVARAVFEAAVKVAAARGGEVNGDTLRGLARRLLLLVGDVPTREAAFRELRERDRIAHATAEHWTAERADGEWKRLHEKMVVLDRKGTDWNALWYEHETATVKDGVVLYYGAWKLGDRGAAGAALELMAEGIEPGAECGEPLYQAVPEPRRIPLSAYLARKRRPVPGTRRRGERRPKMQRRIVDLVIVDEVHESANADSAIGQAMAQWRGTPMLGLTGSFSNGYAVSLFHILHTLSASFREEYERGAVEDFGRDCGYSRRTVEMRDSATKKQVVFGSQSDRVEQTMKMTGYAPGLLPSSLLRHVLSGAVVLHLEDLAINLPPIQEVVEIIPTGDELGKRVRRLRGELVQRIKSDRFTPMQGKLFGQMSEEWSSADRISAGIGNCDDGVYRICYPASVGGGLVAELESMPADVILPKEARLLEIIRDEIAQGRNVLVFAWHAHCGLYERLAKLIAQVTGRPCPILDSNKITARKRDEWLRRTIVAKGEPVLIVNPAAVETGLNSLVHFSTVVWFEPPGCDPKAERQAKGRIRRPRQTKEQRVFWLIYEGTSQELLRKLLLHKVAESMSVDGLDPTAALRASGIGQREGMSGFDVGRQLYLMARAEMGEAA